MASNILAGDQLNFTRMGIASVDEIKVVLADILRCEIKPQHLPKSITSCSELTTGRHKLRPEQQKLCCSSPPAVPDYNKFDVSLLYTLIRNLCPQLKPTQGWGKTPSIKDLQVGDDIERLREFRNEMFAHLDSSCVEDVVFTAKWRDLEQIFQRMQNFLNTKGISVDYSKKLAIIAKSDFGFEDMEKYKIILEGILLILKENGNNGIPSITIHGNDEVFFGEKTCFQALLDQCSPSNNWPITWEKIQGNMTEQLDTSKKKYKGSSSRCLVITDVSKEDEGEYRAVISRENNGKHIKIPSNSKRLTVIGDSPVLTMPKEVEVPYGSVAVLQPIIQACPPPESVDWQKSKYMNPISDEFISINLTSPKFSGSTLDSANSKLVINETTFEDSLFYRLVVKNRVGLSSCSTFLKIVGTPPNVIIKDDTDFLEKSVTLICKVLCESTHPLTGVVWTKDNNEINVLNNSGKYTGSDIENPSLKITRVKASDEGKYECCVSNVVGSTHSKQVTLASPNVKLLIKKKDIKNGTLKLQADIKSIPDACKIEWKAQMTPDGEFQLINMHEETYKGSTISLQNPLLVVNKYNGWETYGIEVTNFLGATFVTSQEAMEETNLPTDSTLGSLNGINLSLYAYNGAAKIKFNNLRLSLIKGITKEEMANLKDTIRKISSVDPESLRNVQDEREFVDLLIDEKVFTERDVITLQYLMRTIGREDLNTECIDYATSMKGRLCYFEQENQAVGCTRVKLHVVDDMENFIRLNCVIETVAAMVQCDPESIKVVGILRKHSFIIVIEVQRELAMLLLQKPAEEIVKLADFKIDGIEIDGEVITIGKQGDVGRYKRETEDKEKESGFITKEGLKRKAIYGLPSLSQGMHGCLEPSMNNPLSQFDEKRAKRAVVTKDKDRKVFMKNTGENEREAENTEKTDGQSQNKENMEKMEDMSTSKYLDLSVVCTSSITVPGVKDVYHISCLTSDRLWISDNDRLLQVDNTGHVIQEMKIHNKHNSPIGAHSVTEDGDLIFINGDMVQKMTLDGTITSLLQEPIWLFCIHYSRINSNILVGSIFGVLRCDRAGGNQMKLECRVIFPVYITENKNGDIWVSDRDRKVVVMDKSGRHRFNYRGQHHSAFLSGGICTDILGQVLVCDTLNSSVHLVDQDGQFLRLLLTREDGLHCPTALCVDDKHNLYVGQEKSNTIKVYKYLQETEDLKTSIVESK